MSLEAIHPSGIPSLHTVLGWATAEIELHGDIQEEQNHSGITDVAASMLVQIEREYLLKIAWVE